MFHNFEMGEGIFMELWHNVILINSERFWEFGGCGYKKPGCHTLLKIGVLGLKSWSGPLNYLVAVSMLQHSVQLFKSPLYLNFYT